MATEHISPEFHFERSPGEEKPCPLYRMRPIYGELWYFMRMVDSPGNIRKWYYPAHVNRWVYFLHQKMAPEIMTGYTKNKIILYENTMSSGDTVTNVRMMSTLFEQQADIAIVADENLGREISGEDLSSKRDGQKYVPILEESENFRVLHFDVNSLKLKTNFPARKFLVYNDSFHSYWKVFINGKEEKIFRANMAFKGVWLPGGENIVYFRYAPPMAAYPPIFGAFFFGAFFLYTTGVFLSNRSPEKT